MVQEPPLIARIPNTPWHKRRGYSFQAAFAWNMIYLKRHWYSTCVENGLSRERNAAGHLGARRWHYSDLGKVSQMIQRNWSPQPCRWEIISFNPHGVKAKAWSSSIWDNWKCSRQKAKWNQQKGFRFSRGGKRTWKWGFARASFNDKVEDLWGNLLSTCGQPIYRYLPSFLLSFSFWQISELNWAI